MQYCETIWEMQEKKFYQCPFLHIRFEKMELFKMHRIKNRRHYFTATFWDLQLCAFVTGWYEHSKGPKSASCLWFGCFSSRVKRCIRVCLQRFTRELKRPNQRQDAFLSPLKCSNHPGTKVQSCRSQKVGFSKWRRFFDPMQFAYAQCPLVGFICR